MEMAKSMNLQNVIWEKRQDPRPFYKSASLFLLTSIVEGWALTLTESMQTGVVPLAFDSYPAVRSIIHCAIERREKHGKQTQPLNGEQILTGAYGIKRYR